MISYLSLTNFSEFDYTIPTFISPSGNTMQIQLVKTNINNIDCYIHFLNNKGENIEFTQLDTNSLSYFINTYRNYIMKVNYNKRQNFFRRIKLNLITIKKALRKKELSIFTFLSMTNISIFSFDKISTFDKSNGSCLANTWIRGGKKYDIYNINTQDKQLYFLHTLCLQLIFNIENAKNKNSFTIIENLLSYIRYIILFLIFIYNIYLYSDISSYLHDPINIIKSDLLWSGISMIVALISRWLPQKIFFYFIDKNISTLFKTKRSTKKKQQLQKKLLNFGM